MTHEASTAISHEWIALHHADLGWTCTRSVKSVSIKKKKKTVTVYLVASKCHSVITLLAPCVGVKPNCQIDSNLVQLLVSGWCLEKSGQLLKSSHL